MTNPNNTDKPRLLERKPDIIFMELFNPKYMKYTWFNRLKVALWNFILPPHIHLHFNREDSEDDK